MRAKRLTKEGIQAFKDFLDRLRRDPNCSVPAELLEDGEFSEVLRTDIDVRPATFKTRYEAAQYFVQLFEGISAVDTRSDVGLWSWLSLFFFDTVCPRTREGRQAGDDARYILQPDNFRHYYRHLLAGPYFIFRAHRSKPEVAMVLLCQPVDRPGDAVEQLASRQEIVTNASLLEAASILYYDPRTKRLKPGAQSQGGGSVRRYVDLVNQLELNWDLYSMSADDILRLLPSEFQRFVPRQAA